MNSLHLEQCLVLAATHSALARSLKLLTHVEENVCRYVDIKTSAIYIYYVENTLLLWYQYVKSSSDYFSSLDVEYIILLKPDGWAQWEITL